jgi:hypothetical protein
MDIYKYPLVYFVRFLFFYNENLQKTATAIG